MEELSCAPFWIPKRFDNMSERRSKMASPKDNREGRTRRKPVAEEDDKFTRRHIYFFSLTTVSDPVSQPRPIPHHH